mmetsp:Transcript_10032/g.13760  ORF Transcript_10032/g.13760 Transcript_10032/m.13760 type:complete len:200 (+) Transcript_10032:703-1302(+)
MTCSTASMAHCRTAPITSEFSGPAVTPCRTASSRHSLSTCSEQSLRSMLTSASSRSTASCPLRLSSSRKPVSRSSARASSRPPPRSTAQKASNRHHVRLSGQGSLHAMRCSPLPDAAGDEGLAAFAGLPSLPPDSLDPLAILDMSSHTATSVSPRRWNRDLLHGASTSTVRLSCCTAALKGPVSHSAPPAPISMPRLDC